jgi:CBS domain-containing protein
MGAMSSELEIGACPVAEVMGTELFTLSPDTAVSSARRLVLENDIDHMLVLDSDGTLAGILCKDDLHSADRNGRVGDCMTSPVVCITPDTTLQEAIDIMGANDIDCLPVVTGSFLVGMVTWNGLALAELTPRVFDVEAVEVETTTRGRLPPGERPREPSDSATPAPAVAGSSRSSSCVSWAGCRCAPAAGTWRRFTARSPEREVTPGGTAHRCHLRGSEGGRAVPPRAA